MICVGLWAACTTLLERSVCVRSAREWPTEKHKTPCEVNSIDRRGHLPASIVMSVASLRGLGRVVWEEGGLVRGY